MRNIISVFFIALLVVSCNSKTEEKAMESGQQLYFAQNTYDFGEIEEDSDGIFDIEFKNISDSAIVINKVRSSCGCTIPSWPKKPIEPGDKGVIQVKYNTALTGSFMKSVYIYSTANNSPVKLIVKGLVTEKN